MDQKIKVAIIFGGKSAEHEVSLQSAKNVIDAIDQDKYEPILIGIDKEGRWHLDERSKLLLNETNPALMNLNRASEEVAIIPDGDSNLLINPKTHRSIGAVDVAFPILHGPLGEDGSIQGMFKMANIPFVGAGILGSAVGMDKDVMKRLFRDAGIPTPRFVPFYKSGKKAPDYETLTEALGPVMFVKPVNLGSSVGVSKISSAGEFQKAVELAFTYDRKIIIEEFIPGREIECSVLGNEHPIASVPGEIVVKHEFYSYECKYIDEHGAALEIPAKLPEETVKEVQRLAIEAFTVLCCQGMARVDCFLTESGEIYVNEINTIPGFTKISMYPKLWEASGIPYPELIDRLIQLALDRFRHEQEILTSI